MDINLLKKYFSNECTNEEVDEVLLWFKNNAGNMGGRSMMKNLWDEIENRQVDEVDFEYMLNKIHHRINVEEANKAFSGKEVVKERFRNIANGLMKVAAILFIPLLVYNIFTFHRDMKEAVNPIYSKVFAPNGSRTTFELPDGTKVWLNSGSCLKFPQKFTGNTRNVELEGEAYFEVVHNPAKPMIVKADRIFIKVLGTKFNVMNYKYTEVEVALLEGSVSLNRLNSNKKLKEVLELKPGQLAVYRKEDHKVKYGTVNVNKYIAWTKGIVMFENDPLSRVAQSLSRIFNADVVIKDEDIMNYTFTATFIDESLPQIMKLIKLALPVKYKIIKSRKQPDGTFSKTKVIIKKR